MGYYAYGSGYVVLKEGCTFEDVNKAYKESGYDFGDLYPEEGTYDYTIGIIMENQKYYEEDVDEFFKVMEPFITYAMIDFIGEDGAHWCIEFKDGKATEIDGKVVYGMADYSDQELIKELESRGYKIKKED